MCSETLPELVEPMPSCHLQHDWFERPLPHNVRVGAESWLYSSYAFLHYRSSSLEGVAIGNNTGIYNGTFFDLGPRGSARIGNFCTIVGAVFSSNGRIIVGDYVLIAHEVTIADTGFATPLHRDNRESPDLIIGDNVWIGARATLLGGLKIGEGSVIGAAAVVDFDVPRFSVVAGNPARLVRSLA